MNATFMLTSAAALLITSTCFSAPAQQSNAPQPLRIDVLEERTAPDWFTGTWTASGCFEDSGTTEISVLFTGPSSLPVAAKVDHFLTTSLGTIHIRSHVAVTWSLNSFPDHVAEGNFTILSGTGAYEGLHGRGTVSFIVDFMPIQTPDGPTSHVELKGTYLGQANFAP